MQKDSLQQIVAFIIGLLIGGFLVNMVIGDSHFHTDQHPIADPYDTDYHVHADFHIVINDELVDLSTDKYMTTAEQALHPDAHLHDGEGDMKHIHAEGVTFASFLEALGIVLTSECVGVDGEEYCADDTKELTLYVENEPYTGDMIEYIPVDDERILLHYGLRENPNLDAYLDAVPDDSCIYSGTCPERGTAPPESCGLTCEL